jgi:integrase
MGIACPMTECPPQGGNSNHDLVFATDRGSVLHPNTLARRFHQLIERAGVPVIRFHDLRHTNATVDLATGTHPKVVQERLGHASISETLDRYSHLTPNLQREAADRLDAAIEAAGHDTEQTA